MHVLATAGHVDHGKSTLVRALTGMEPDRWAEERRRGMTIDLGYAWTTLPDGQVVAFVDVPGHARFIGNMLAGLGPAPAVMFVVAADEGWRRQSEEHLAAVDALDVRHGLLVVTRSDLADPRPAAAEALQHLRASSLGDVPVLHTSGTTGAGLDELRTALGALALPATDGKAPVRLWVDRAFTVRGAGTVVTGTLSAGSLAVDDRLELGDRLVRVRALQSLGAPVTSVTTSARVAVNLRGAAHQEVGRGDVLLTPGHWRGTRVVDVRLTAASPKQVVLHVGSASVACQVRPLGADLARLTLHRPLPLEPGDRALLRDPGGQRITAGLVVVDTDPPPVRGRGAVGLRVAQLQRTGDRQGEQRRRFRDCVARAVGAVDAHTEADPLAAGLPVATLRARLGLPAGQPLAEVIEAAGLEVCGTVVRRPGALPQLGPVEQSVRVVEADLAVRPFEAPDAARLAGLGLGPRQLAAAVTAGRLLRLPGEVVLLPDAPDRAARVLAGLAQPFTVSQARQALDTSRRVAVPLLGHLDAQGRTVRLADGSRRLAD